MTEILDNLLTVFQPYTEDDKQRLTHVVSVLRSRTPEQAAKQLSAQDIVDLARLNGTEIVALCGYRWVPLHDPSKYPICKVCAKMMERIQHILGE